MIPINLSDFDTNPKKYRGQNKAGVYFILRSNNPLSNSISYNNIKKYDKDVLYIGSSSTSYFARMKMHIKSFKGVTEGVDTPQKFADCAERNNNRIDNLYIVCYKGLSKEAENNRYKAYNGKFPCANTKAK